MHGGSDQIVEGLFGLAALLVLLLLLLLVVTGHSGRALLVQGGTRGLRGCGSSRGGLVLRRLLEEMHGLSCLCLLGKGECVREKWIVVLVMWNVWGEYV